MKHLFLILSLLVVAPFISTATENQTDNVGISFMKTNLMLLNPTLAIPVQPEYNDIFSAEPEDIDRRRRRRGRSSFGQGTNVISLGWGIPNLGRAVFKAQADLYGNDARAFGFGPAFVKYEYGVSDNIGLGAVIRIMSNGIEFPIDDFAYDDNGQLIDTTYNYTYKASHFAVMARFNYHFATSRKLDPYVGLGIGYGNTNYTFDYGGDDDAIGAEFKSIVPIGMELTVGTRYYFSDNFGIYGELGLSKSIANLGVSLKFP